MPLADWSRSTSFGPLVREGRRTTRSVKAVITAQGRMWVHFVQPTTARCPSRTERRETNNKSRAGAVVFDPDCSAMRADEVFND